ncbi:uncharacterized protein LOC124134148 [Haliotis rufescens]|uniref:uncharacterized protein LOC124134148 n=1 Tax=Haliotis rufescens TaxID=6454 RepID=UPI001EB016F5|nr:uncharacterized protein LOC124134148 [Haliotis rufescens]
MKSAIFNPRGNRRCNQVYISVHEEIGQAALRPPTGLFKKPNTRKMEQGRRRHHLASVMSFHSRVRESGNSGDLEINSPEKPELCLGLHVSVYCAVRSGQDSLGGRWHA